MAFPDGPGLSGQALLPENTRTFQITPRRSVVTSALREAWTENAHSSTDHKNRGFAVSSCQSPDNEQIQYPHGVRSPTKQKKRPAAGHKGPVPGREVQRRLHGNIWPVLCGNESLSVSFG